MERETETPPTTPVGTEIIIIVNSIENLEQEMFLNLIIEHNDVLGSSPPIKVDPDVNNKPCPIEYSVHLPLDNWQNIYNIVSTPILIKVIESSAEERSPSQDDLHPTGVKKKEKHKNKMKSSSLRNRNIIGMSSLDIHPILLGETTIKEKLIIEAPILSWNSNSVSWRNLPLLSVTVTQVGPNFFATETGINYLNVTIESIYNPPSFFTPSSEYECGTVIYIDTEVSETVIFDGGKWTKFHDVENKKQWKTLSNLENRGKFSKYKISPDYENVHNRFKDKINLQEIVDLDVPRVEWNYVNRNLMRRSGVEVMQQHIEKYKYWPIQILVRDKNSEVGKGKSKDFPKQQIYQCYVDLTELLYPGKTRVRAIAQLFTHSMPEMMQKTGLNKDIFSRELQKELKDKEKKYKSNFKSNSSDVQHLDSPNSDQSSSSPLMNEEGDPTVILIEFELHQPLKKSGSTDEYSDEIARLIKKTKPLRPYILTSDLAEEQFSDCVKKLVEIITERYQNFVEERGRTEKKKQKEFVTEGCRDFRDTQGNEDINDEEIEDSECHYHYIADELQCFVQHLHNAGEYIDIRNTLKNKIIHLLDQKFKSEMYSWDTKESQVYNEHHSLIVALGTLFPT